ncbi:MAG: cysteine desulfurase [Bacteroidia bacterium]|nr:cysteine desulfurase [Bacteroidia bacterium]MCZ2276392.1 cysteine desulfurase [Bacteroidia bacterium]
MTAETIRSLTNEEISLIRKEFPVLQQKIYGKPLVYFDNAATAQKPDAVIKSLTEFYSEYNSNIHRGVHFLSQKASDAYEQVREKVRNFIHAESESEVVFTRGTTESINLVAQSFGKAFVTEGDEVIISAMEHHSNIVPWQMMCEERKAVLRVIPINEKGELLTDELEKTLNSKTKIISVVHISNSLGTVNPVKKLIAQAHRREVPVLIDAAQSIAHEQIDVNDLDCDFMAFSSHKMLGPTGVGVLYAKRKWLEALPPYQGGGDMISGVSFEKTTYNEIPFRFEAGTQNIADVIAFGTSIDYLQSLDRKRLLFYEHQLLSYATERIKEVEGIRIIGTASEKSGILSFLIKGGNAMDIGMYLDTQGIAVRTGHHCTQPVMNFFKIPGTIRASFLFYNTISEIDIFIEALKKAARLFHKK